MTAVQSANLTELCCRNIIACGTNIALVTGAFDGMISNLSMGTILGANLDIRNFDPFFINGIKIGIILDPPHMLKNVRNMFASHRGF